jgi:hypothetical protein
MIGALLIAGLALFAAVGADVLLAPAVLLSRGGGYRSQPLAGCSDRTPGLQSIGALERFFGERYRRVGVEDCCRLCRCTGRVTRLI